MNKVQKKLPFLEPWPLVTGCWVGYAVSYSADEGFRRLETFAPHWGVPFDGLISTWWGWIAYAIVLNLAVGAALGFAAGYYAQHHKMRHAIVAGVVLRIGEQISSYQGFRLSFLDLLLLSFTFIIMIGGSVYGAYMAQSFQRNRGVKIE